MRDAVAAHGTGAGGTRNISGTSASIVSLENELASLHAKERALVFTSGYVANEASISALISLLDNPIILSDSMNHASIISGIRYGRAEKMIFRHNDTAHLEELLKTLPKTGIKSLFSDLSIRWMVMYRLSLKSLRWQKNITP